MVRGGATVRVREECVATLANWILCAARRLLELKAVAKYNAEKLAINSHRRWAQPHSISGSVRMQLLEGTSATRLRHSADTIGMSGALRTSVGVAA